MKAVMEVSPSSRGVKVSGRVARRHYGLIVGAAFEEKKHETLRRLELPVECFSYIGL